MLAYPRAVWTHTEFLGQSIPRVDNCNEMSLSGCHPQLCRAAASSDVGKPILDGSRRTWKMNLGLVVIATAASLAKAGVESTLMASTPAAYPQVVSRNFTSFRVLRFHVSAVHGDFRDGFDSRQLH